jgi:hydrogenase maturation protease
MNCALVIGYGNELRGDDGLGPYIAASIEARNLPDVRVLTVRQLTPELAEQLSNAAVAVFVDASMQAADNGVEVKAVAPGAVALSMTHVFDPQVLLAIAQALYGRAPRAWAVHVAGDNFTPGEGLTAAARRRADAAARAITALLREPSCQ